MKSFFTIAVCTILLCACTKTGNDLSGELFTASSSENLSQQKLTKTLITHPWMYQEFYSHYVNEQNKGQRFYDRDSTGNLDEYLADVVFTFHKNNTFTKYVSPYTYHGTWSFSDNKPTFLILNFTYGSETDSIALFNIDHLNYFKKDNYSHWYTALVATQ